MSTNRALETNNYHKKLSQGYMLIENGLYSKAIEHFINTLSNFPNDADVFIGLALGYYHLNKPKEAIQAANNAVTIDPNNYEAFEVLAWIYFFNKNDFILAEEYTLKALNLKPNDSDLFSLLSQIYYFQGVYNKSYQSAIIALQHNPNNYIAHMTLGLYYFIFNEHSRSEEHFLKCLEIAPNNPSVYCNYGLLSIEFAKNKKAYTLLREAVRLNPDVDFYQKSFRMAFIKNHLLYLPLNLLHFDNYFPYFISFTVVFWIVSAVFSQLEDLKILPTYLGKILLVFSIIIFLMILFLVFYKLIIICILNILYSWAVKNGKLSRII